MGIFREILSAIRVINCLIAMGGVWLGALLIGLHGESLSVLLASVATFLLCGAGNLMNDLVDFETDRVSHPERAIVSGRLARSLALALAVGMSIASLMLAGTVGMSVLIAAAVAAVLLVTYNLSFQHLPLAGNILVAFLAALTLFTGASATGQSFMIATKPILMPAWFAFLIHLIREIVKDIQDEPGDRMVGDKSFPIVCGKRAALRLVCACVVLLAVSTIVPFVTGLYKSSAYLLLVVFLVDLPAILLIVSTLRSPGGRQIDRLAHGLKLIMLSGMLALFFT